MTKNLSNLFLLSITEDFQGQESEHKRNQEMCYDIWLILFLEAFANMNAAAEKLRS